MIDVSFHRMQATNLRQISNNTLNSVISKCDQVIANAKRSGNNSYSKKVIQMAQQIKTSVQVQKGQLQSAASSIENKAQQIYSQEYAKFLERQRQIEEMNRQNH